MAPVNGKGSIAYFTMEIGLESGIPTYSGGLGVLAGDTIRAAADLEIPMVAVTLLDRKGYFYQSLNPAGIQTEMPVLWPIDDFLEEVPKKRATITLEGRNVQLRCWKYQVAGITNYTVDVYFLDADVPENAEQDRHLSDFLYGGDDYYRLCQEAILGIGGVRMLRALGYDEIDRYHMNEGHSSLLALELLEEEVKKRGKTEVTQEDIETVRKKCVFTTHTPVLSGQDRFPMDLVVRVLGDHQAFALKEVFYWEDRLNMTYLALNLSHYINGVAKRHGEISRLKYARYSIDAITNGVHAATWASKSFQELYDRYIPGWRQDNFSLRYALTIPKAEIWKAHMEEKKSLLQFINQETNEGMDFHVFTIGFARRATTYKRPDLLFEDIARLKSISEKIGPIQLVFSGKAHPKDEQGKELIRKIFNSKKSLEDAIRIAYLQNYDMEIAGKITAGVDLWLNTPQPPMEASGTSGMKAAINGIPSLSILDGWWIEGHIEGITGWAIGQDGSQNGAPDSTRDAACLYEKLESTILPIFYEKRDEYVNIMAHCIALNGSFFNTQRMIQQYVLNAYYR